jgi:hypothetical protein
VADREHVRRVNNVRERGLALFHLLDTIILHDAFAIFAQTRCISLIESSNGNCALPFSLIVHHLLHSESVGLAAQRTREQLAKLDRSFLHSIIDRTAHLAYRLTSRTDR